MLMSLVSVLAAGSAPAPAGAATIRTEAAQPAPTAAGEAMDSFFAPWASSETPGCVAAAAQKGRTLLTKAYGMADLEHDVPNSVATRFEIGSNSKQFTAAAILLLAEQGKLRLDDDVRKYVPELPDYKVKITLDHLLNHSSGLRDWGEVAAFQGWPRTSRAYTNADALDIIVRQRGLNHAPGEGFSYTNSGYVLLAVVVERVSGMSLPSFTRDRIFKPLGMDSTEWRDDFRRVVKNRAIAYWKAGAGYAQLMPFENVYGPGGLLSTVADMLTWNRALDEGRLGAFVTTELQRETRDNRGRPLGYGRGLFLGKYKDHRMVFHGGTTGAYQAALSRYPDAGLSIVILCNADEATTGSIQERMVDLLLPPAGGATAAEGPAADIVLTPREAAALAGTYLSDFTGLPATIVAEGNVVKGRGRVLRPVARDRFRAGSTEIAFIGSGALEVIDGPRKELFRRIEKAAHSDRDLEAIVGHYWSEEVGNGYIATLEGGKLVLRHDLRSSVSAPFSPVGKDVFTGPGNIVLRVQRAPGGAVSSIAFSAPRIRELRFARTK
jgi:CubicO group peptidase (beta-lactamase class C family)